LNTKKRGEMGDWGCEMVKRREDSRKKIDLLRVGFRKGRYERGDGREGGGIAGKTSGFSGERKGSG